MIRTVAATVLLLGSPAAASSASGAAASGAPATAIAPRDTVPGAELIPDSRHHLVVAVEGPGAMTGTLQRMERRDDGWVRVGRPVPVVVGHGGVGPKREGDGRSPRGIFPLGPAFGYASDPPAGLRWPYRAMSPGAVCVDDPSSALYDRIVDPDTLSVRAWSSAEAMRRDRVHGDDLYEWGVQVTHNPDGRPGAGSCIFLHVWRSPESPTAGCTAMPRARLLELLSALEPRDRPVLVQGSRTWLEELRRSGVLPYPVPGVPER